MFKKITTILLLSLSCSLSVQAERIDSAFGISFGQPFFYSDIATDKRTIEPIIDEDNNKTYVFELKKNSFFHLAEVTTNKEQIPVLITSSSKQNSDLEYVRTKFQQIKDILNSKYDKELDFEFQETEKTALFSQNNKIITLKIHTHTHDTPKLFLISIEYKDISKFNKMNETENDIIRGYL